MLYLLNASKLSKFHLFEHSHFALFFLSVAPGTMLPRNLRTGGYDLPGVESNEVPLIGYRPLTPDSGTPSNQSGRGSSSDVLETSQVCVFLPFASSHHFVAYV